MKMLNLAKIIALRMERQHLIRKAMKSEYNALYRDLQPGKKCLLEWLRRPAMHEAPSQFDDMEYNRLGQIERYTPEIEDVLLELPPKEAAARKDEVLAAIHEICSWAQPPKRYQEKEVCGTSPA